VRQDCTSFEPVRSFDQAVEFLERAINYETVRGWHYGPRSLNLLRTEQLLEALGNPHRRYRIVHVAGTKGKGTTAGAIAQCLHEFGHSVGLLTSPHLVTARERIRLDGRDVDEASFVRCVRRMQPYVERKRAEEGAGGGRAPTYFEMLTALAFDCFAEQGVDWAVVEVGLGGRLDSTNVVQPQCCVITTIGFDHTDKLGDTAEEIAAEKAGILKPGVPVVIGHQRYPGALETLRRHADERGCRRWEVGREVRVSEARPLAAPPDAPEAPLGWLFSLSTPEGDLHDLSSPLLGTHQLDNLAGAVAAIALMRRHAGLEADMERLRHAIAGFSMPGRIELLQRSPAVILDVAHTVESVEALTSAIETHLPGRKVHFVFGCSVGKRLEGMLGRLLPGCASLTATQAKLPRALPAAEVALAARQLAGQNGPAIEVMEDPWEALRAALRRAGPQDVVCVTGSFYVAGEVRAAWLRDHPELAD